MVATGGGIEDFYGGSDSGGGRINVKYERVVAEPKGLNPDQERIAIELKVHSLDENAFNHARRAGTIREHIEWILDDSKDMEAKGMAGFLTQEYKKNLLAVVEQALPYLVLEHDESHPEFPMLRSTIDELRNKI